MKKIAFFVQHMLCGGVENALITLSQELYNHGNEVTIYVISETGDFADKIPKGVMMKKIFIPQKIERFLPVGGTKIAIRKNISEGHYIRALINLIKHVFGESEFAELNVDFNKIPMIDIEYDIAVNFHMHSPFLVRYLSEKVYANKKLTWIHNDFTTTGYNIKNLQQCLECCEGFYAVSQRLKKEFVDIFPEYEDKTEVIYNIIPRDEIIKKADRENPYEYASVPKDNLIFLSVGRLEYQKGYDLTIQVCRKLMDKGLKFKWFVLGEGTERKNLEQMLKRQGLQDTLFFLGIRMNPYPYFKYCDIYIQTSRHEGYVTTVTEAKVFNRPIICTDVSGAREQIEDKITGYVVDFYVDEIANRIFDLSINKNLRCDIEKNLILQAKEHERENYMMPFI